LVFEFQSGSDLSLIQTPAGNWRPFYELQRGTILYEDISDKVYMDYDHCVSVHCDPMAGYTRWLVLHPDDGRCLGGTHLLFTIVFLELLKRRSRYSLHAAGLYLNGKSLLIAGPSGFGKTTLAIALVRAGFDFLGDDTVLLMHHEEGVRICALPEQLAITQNTTSFFPELAYLLAQPRAKGRPKREIDINDVFGTRIVWNCNPNVVVFPRIANTSKSMLSRISPAEALAELLPNVLLTEAVSSQAHLNILGRLARENRCYRLDTGKDFDEIPKLLRDVLLE